MSTYRDRVVAYNSLDFQFNMVERANSILYLVNDTYFDQCKPGEIDGTDFELVRDALETVQFMLSDALRGRKLETGTGQDDGDVEAYFYNADAYRKFREVSRLHHEVSDLCRNAQGAEWESLTAQQKKIMNMEDDAAIQALEKMIADIQPSNVDRLTNTGSREDK